MELTKLVQSSAARMTLVYGGRGREVITQAVTEVQGMGDER